MHLLQTKTKGFGILLWVISATTFLMGQGLKLEYKAVSPTQPGQTGFMDYYSVYIGTNQIRQDINNSSSIIQRPSGQRWELNHLTQTYVEVFMSKEQEGTVFLKQEPFQVSFKQWPCYAYSANVHVDKQDLTLTIWFSQKRFGHLGSNLLEMWLQQPMAGSFPMGTPEGVPVRFEVKQNLTSGRTKSLLSIECLKIQEEEAFDSSLFQIPPGYKAVSH